MFGTKPRVTATSLHGHTAINGRGSMMMILAGVVVLVIGSMTLLPAASRCHTSGKGWLCMSSNAHSCDTDPLTCFTYAPVASSIPAAIADDVPVTRVKPPKAAVVPDISVLSDVDSTSAEWHRGNAIRRTSWLAQLDAIDGTNQADEYDSTVDELRIWAHAPFYPIWTCPFTLRLGNIEDGGKWVCRPNKLSFDNSGNQDGCIVYSFGSNGDFSFESSILLQNPECDIHTFDPLESYADLAPTGVTYHAMALTGNTQRASSPTPAPGSMMAKAKTISEVRQMLHHNGKRVAILKMDIEWSEYYFLDDYFRAGNMWAQQILMEIHLPMSNSYSLLSNIFRLMDRNGYRLFAKEHNIDCRVCHEFAWYYVDNYPTSSASDDIAAGALSSSIVAATTTPTSSSNSVTPSPTKKLRRQQQQQRDDRDNN